jgi:hypothetical protein
LRGDGVPAARNGPVVGLLIAWLLLALAAGATGRTGRLIPPIPQLVLAGLTIALIVLERRAQWLRVWVATVNIRTLVALHVTRFVGIGFLLLGRRGELPAAFATPAGWGDIAAATLAGLLLIAGDPASPRWRGWFRVWNGLGLLDLVFVVVTAGRLALADPGSMGGLLRLPLCLLPTFLVPVLLASHVWLFRRLSNPRVVAAWRSGSNAYFSLEPGYTQVDEGGAERLTITVTRETRVVDGVTTRVVEERETRAGQLVEVSRNFFAIGKRTHDVYDFGEAVDLYRDGRIVSHDGSWLAGVDSAHFGLMMPGQPHRGERHYQELAPAVALDRAEVVGVSEAVATPAGRLQICLKVKETTPLKPGAKEYKY